MGDAYSFLQQQGCINMGVPAGEPGQDQEPEEEPDASPTDEDIIRALQEILKKADLQVGFLSAIAISTSYDCVYPLTVAWCNEDFSIIWLPCLPQEILRLPTLKQHLVATFQETTERMVRKQVQSRLGVDMSHRKAFIKEQVSACSLPIPFERGPFQPSRSKAVLEAPRGAKGFWPIIATTHLISLDGLAVWFMLDVYLPTVPNGQVTQASSVNSITASAVCTVQLAHCLYCAASPQRGERTDCGTRPQHTRRDCTLSAPFSSHLCAAVHRLQSSSAER